MEETLAAALVEKNKNRIFRYEGKDPEWHLAEGTFEILEDLNCCAPTQNILFAFVCPARRKVMTAEQCLTFFEDCSSANA